MGSIIISCDKNDECHNHQVNHGLYIVTLAFYYQRLAPLLSAFVNKSPAIKVHVSPRSRHRDHAHGPRNTRTHHLIPVAQMMFQLGTSIKLPEQWVKFFLASWGFRRSHRF